VKKFTVNDYQTDLLKRIRSQNRDLVYVWKYHGENTSPKVISIRAVEVNLTRQPLKYGNRLVVQALVKFDTLQVSTPLKYTLFDILTDQSFMT
jgi:mitochondrial protein MBA1